MLRQPTPQTSVEMIAHLRRQRWTGKQIALEVGVSAATVRTGWASTSSAHWSPYPSAAMSGNTQANSSMAGGKNSY
jgi:hypothetical protein